MQEFSPELISRYLDDDLSTTERVEVEELLVSNADARKLYQELRELGSSLRALPKQTPALDFSENILGRIAAQETGDQETSDNIAEDSSPANASSEDATPQLAPAATAVDAASATSTSVRSAAVSSRRWTWNSQSWPNAAAAAAVLLAAVTYMLAGPFDSAPFESSSNGDVAIVSERLKQRNAAIEATDESEFQAANQFHLQGDLESNFKNKDAKLLVIPQPNTTNEDDLTSGDSSLANNSRSGVAEDEKRPAETQSSGADDDIKAAFDGTQTRGGRGILPGLDKNQPLADQGVELKTEPPSEDTDTNRFDADHLGFLESLAILGKAQANPEFLIVQVDVDEVAWDNEAFRHFLEDNQIVWADAPETESFVADREIGRYGATTTGQRKEANADGDRDRADANNVDAASADGKIVTRDGNNNDAGQSGNGIKDNLGRAQGDEPPQRGSGRNRQDLAPQPAYRGPPTDAEARRPQAIPEGFFGSGPAANDSAPEDVQLVYVEADVSQVRNMLTTLQAASPEQETVAGLSYANAVTPESFGRNFYGLEGVTAGAAVSERSAGDLFLLGQQIRSYYFQPPAGGWAENPPPEVAATAVDDMHGGQAEAQGAGVAGGGGGGLGGGGLLPPGQDQSDNQQQQAGQSIGQAQANDANSAAGDSASGQAGETVTTVSPESSTKPPVQSFYKRLSLPLVKSWINPAVQEAERLQELERAQLQFDFAQGQEQLDRGRPSNDVVSEDAPPRQRILFVLRKIVEPPLRAPDPGQ